MRAPQVYEGVKFPFADETWIVCDKRFAGRWWCVSEDRCRQTELTGAQIRAAITKAEGN